MRGDLGDMCGVTGQARDPMLQPCAPWTKEGICLCWGETFNY